MADHIRIACPQEVNFHDKQKVKFSIIHTYPSAILAVLFRARHAVSAAKGIALASYIIRHFFRNHEHQ